MAVLSRRTIPGPDGTSGAAEQRKDGSGAPLLAPMALAAEAAGDGVEVGVVQRVRGLVLDLGLGLGLVLFGLARLGHAGTSGAVLTQAGMPAMTRKSLSVPRSWIIVPVRGLSVRDPAPGHDPRNALGIAGAEIVPAFKDFEDIFVVGQPD